MNTPEHRIVRPIDPALLTGRAQYERLHHSFKSGTISQKDTDFLLEYDPMVSWLLSMASADSGKPRAVARTIELILMSSWRLNEPVSMPEVILASYLLPLNSPPTIANLAVVLSRVRPEFFGSLSSSSSRTDVPVPVPWSPAPGIAAAEVFDLDRDDIDAAIKNNAYMPHMYTDFKNGTQQSFPRSYIWMPWNSGVMDFAVNSIDQRFDDGSGLFWVWLSKYLFPSWQSVLIDSDGSRRSYQEQTRAIIERAELIRDVDLYPAIVYMLHGLCDAEAIKHAVEYNIDVDTATAVFG